MKRKRGIGVSTPLVLAAGAALGYAAVKGMRALLGLRPGADVAFFDRPTTGAVDVGSAQVGLPIKYYREDSFMGVFGAAYEPVRARLPSDELYPVTLPDGRAMLVVIAFNYLQTDIGPYGEIGVVLPCTLGRPGPPLVPLFLEARYPGWGGFVLHLPVTSMIARDGGRVIYGYTKFVSDMAFEKRPAYQRVRLSEGGKHILTLTVQQRGITLRDNRPLVTYSVRGGELLRTVVPSRAVYQMGLRPGLGSLELGDHPVAGQLRELQVAPRALFTKNYLSRAGILPAGEPVGRAGRPHEGYIGEDREFGRLTLSYRDGQAIDLYARAGE